MTQTSTPATRTYARRIVGSFTGLAPEATEVARLVHVTREALNSSIVVNPRQRFYAQRNVNIMAAHDAWVGPTASYVAMGWSV